MQKQEKISLFKEVMGDYPTGVAIITTVGKDGKPVGLTVSSLSSVSINPLLISWCIDEGSSSLEAFEKANGFIVHILNGEQAELCKTFASKNADKFSNCDWEYSKSGLPIISDTLAVLECNTYKQVEAGDHTMLIGEVTDIHRTSDKDPMLYHRRKFGFIPSDFYKEGLGSK
jgi:flavin reductase (DIM6/NTAB) family NADH-FMN oxidoreductase RutF